MTVEAGVLYVVATPIGNLADWSTRAVETLRSVNLIYAEDTRHSASLMAHHAIGTPLRSLHEHNEEARVEELSKQLRNGDAVALISDAGTPLISDPGFKLVRSLRSQGFRIMPIPGACAIITALSAAGLPTDRFCFEGFLPAKAGNRRQRLQQLTEETRTMVFYEAPHRIVETLSDAVQIFGVGREAVLARELTKTFETFLSGTLAEIQTLVNDDANQQKGEMVLMITGAAERVQDDWQPEAERVLTVLMAELPLSQAVALAERLTGIAHKPLYKLALHLKKAD